MGLDLNSLVSEYLTPQAVSQIASTAGVDPEFAQKLISGAIPSVLASLGAAVAAPGGARTISDAISNADPDLLTKLTTALGAENLQMLDDGAKALSGLIGANKLSALANALGQYAGIPPEAARSALGAVSQAVIGVIGQQDPSNWSDAASIASFIASQKDSIMAALPPGLSSMLGASGLLAGLGGLGAAATTRATSAASSATGAASSAMGQAQSAASGSGMPTWLIAVIVIVVIAAAAFYYFKKKDEKPAASLGPATIELTLAPAASEHT